MMEQNTETSQRITLFKTLSKASILRVFSLSFSDWERKYAVNKKREDSHSPLCAFFFFFVISAIHLVFARCKQISLSFPSFCSSAFLP